MATKKPASKPATKAAPKSAIEQALSAIQGGNIGDILKSLGGEADADGENPISKMLSPFSSIPGVSQLIDLVEKSGVGEPKDDPDREEKIAKAKEMTTKVIEAAPAIIEEFKKLMAAAPAKPSRSLSDAKKTAPKTAVRKPAAQQPQVKKAPKVADDGDTISL